MQSLHVLQSAFAAGALKTRDLIVKKPCLLSGAAPPVFRLLSGAEVYITTITTRKIRGVVVEDFARDCGGDCACFAALLDPTSAWIYAVSSAWRSR